MIWEWVAEKSTSLMAFLVALIFVGLAFLHGQYLYFYYIVALCALLYGLKRLRKHTTPFERREQETRRRRL